MSFLGRPFIGFLSLAQKRLRRAPPARRLCSATARMQPRVRLNEQGSIVKQVGERHFNLPTPQETWLLGSVLARIARPGDVLLLRGGLGAGKTTLARGFVQTFMNDLDLDVVSPTYLLDLSYPDYEGRAIVPGATVHHLDLYRLGSAEERPIVDFDEIFSNHICLVEWPERLGKHSKPDEYLSILLSFVSEAEGPRNAKLSGFSNEKSRANPRWSQKRIDQIEWLESP
ncbi:hypothetical protein CCYA_CCYA17G4335 [Cyanidiococcus yangmingshanensis]|nr:hypothetical protein CCYA_CCYA17G4335 [Cyanidiococcus yangmingshanensis]